MKSNIGVTACVCSMSFPVSCDHGFSVVGGFPFHSVPVRFEMLSDWVYLNLWL